MSNIENSIRLTQFSKGSGCGCKIAPQVLEQILKTNCDAIRVKELLVGNESKDDAAVYDLGNGMALISTVDFFTPIVDDAFEFGQIASANAISDVYAMGGKPLFATAILGWPVDKLSPELAAKVLDGSMDICKEVHIPLAGGHSIDSPEPFFGLSVNGLVQTKYLKRNNTAKAGDLIYLTKPLGSGILSAAQKREKLLPEHKEVATSWMKKINVQGAVFGELDYVHAITDVTGFGLLGHLIEMVEGSKLGAELFYDKVQLMDGVKHYIAQMCVPDNTYRNWNSYEKKVQGIGGESLFTLCDPQTNGGLMLAVDASKQTEFEHVLKNMRLDSFIQPIGIFINTSGIKIV